MIKHVEIIYDQIEENEEYNKLIEKVINECFKNENMQGLKLYVSITLTVPEVIHELNKEYRNIDRPTDVLSFPMFEADELEEIKKNDVEEMDILGDMVISIPKVKEQAVEYGHSFERELAYMCVHSFYHLLGYDHMVEEDKVKMRAKEDEVLNILKITREG
jgi:probable rRNA maturation factor